MSMRTFKIFTNLSLERKLLLVSAVPILAVSILSVVTYELVQTFSHDVDRLNQVYHVQSASSEYMRLVVDLETGFRGFVLTTQPQFLQPYEAAKKRVLFVGRSLRQMVNDNDSQRQLIDRTQALVQQLLTEKDHLIKRSRQGFPDDALQYVALGSGRALMLGVREEMATFDRNEVALLREALASSSDDRTMLLGAVVGGGILALVFMILPLQLIARSITGPLTALAKTVGDVAPGILPEFPVLDRQDEIGHLTRVMHGMNEQIREHIDRIQQSEQELRVLNLSLSTSEAKYRGIVDHAPIGIFTSHENLVIFSNRQNWRLAGQNPDNGLDPEGMWEKIHPDDRQQVREVYAAAVTHGVTFEKVFRFLHPNGAVRTVLSRAVPIQHGEDEPLVYQGFNVDITTLEQMRAQLSRGERLVTLGQVAAGIAHEIRNPLVGIGSTTSLLMDDLEPDDARRADLATILKETRRLDRIVNQIVEYARPRELALTTFSVADILRETLEVLQEPVTSRGIVTEFPPNSMPLTIQADRDLLKQVLLNVIQNGVEAMSPGGTLRLAVSEQPREDAAGIAIEVQDTGKGIAPADLQKIFDPFFSMGKRHGTGLGLAICRNIIEAHGGEIHATSQLNVGTVLTVWLPMVHQYEITEG